jgi:hypothetical protein
MIILLTIYIELFILSDYREISALCIGHSVTLPQNLHHRLERPFSQQLFHMFMNLDGQIKHWHRESSLLNFHLVISE